MKELNNEGEIYTPCPLNTSGVELSNDLMRLSEQMSENVHEVWASTRISQGWTYGIVRDDKKKTHPCLVPYDQLSEEEKKIDRNTCIETLKYIISKGYSIVKG